MNKGASVVLILILSLFCLPFTISAGSYSNVAVSEANNLIDSNPSLVVLDVRTQSEYDSGHIRNAKLIPVSELGGRLNELDKTSEILVYCKSGARSATANQILVDNGFFHIYNMVEGVTAWISAGYPVYVKYSSIQEAVNNASEGDTIFVSSGIYYEHLVLNKTVRLVGEDSETTVVYGDGTQTVLKLINRDVNVTRFKIQNGTNGVYISDNADFCIINDCDIVNNRIGVFVEDSDSNLIKGNIIFNNSEQGIKIFASCDCEPVWENIVTDNELVGNSIGILLVNSQLGMIYHNYFINNLFQAYGSGNTAWNKPDKWDNGYPSGGNYWGDYTGDDLDYDGIGDSWYKIDENNIDNYPLIGMFSSSNTSYGYIVDFVSNSSISEFSFNLSKIEVYPPEAILAFNVSGDNDTDGFLRICIPKILINGSYVIMFDDEIITNTTYPQVRELPCSNETYEYLYINYTHSKHAIIITGTTVIPEFSSFLILPLFMIAALLAVIVYKRKHRQR